MNKLSIITCIAFVAVLVSCSTEVKRKPSNIYMPDMAYSRAYETYAERDSLLFTTDESQRGDKIFYNNQPVAGTIARGEEFPFPLTKDKTGDTTNYFASKQIKSPIDSLSKEEYTESERLYLINCGICHGAKLDGNGPLYKGGEGPFPAKPRALVGDAYAENMPEGQMFYSVMYGKNLMGSYASQLNRKQRWQIIRYIKTKQAANKPAATDATAKK